MKNKKTFSAWYTKSLVIIIFRFSTHRAFATAVMTIRTHYRVGNELLPFDGFIIAYFLLTVKYFRFDLYTCTI